MSALVHATDAYVPTQLAMSGLVCILRVRVRVRVRVRIRVRVRVRVG